MPSLNFFFSALMVTVIVALGVTAIIGIIATEGIAGVGGTRIPWAFIKPTACTNIAAMDFKYGDLTNLLLSQPWNIYPNFGICPIAGIEKKCVGNCGNRFRRMLSENQSEKEHRKLQHGGVIASSEGGSSIEYLYRFPRFRSVEKNG